MTSTSHPYGAVGVCRCGHNAHEHFDSRKVTDLAGTAYYVRGHGVCVAPDCSCTGFTWERFEENDDR